jgi:glyoxylase-like metal-dependent hydrolase (beta-lactamase superfamily II)
MTLPDPGFHRFNLGEFKVTCLLDCRETGNAIHDYFGIDHPAEEVHAFCRANGIDPEAYDYNCIPTLVDTGLQRILFDTGTGTLRREQAGYEDMAEGRLAERLGQCGCYPNDIDVVVLSHGHPDHIGGLVRGGEPVYRNARYVFGVREFEFWRNGKNIRKERVPDRELFMRIAVPLADRVVFVDPGDEIVPGIRAIDVSGHSPGMIACHVESGGHSLLIWADTCTQHAVSIRRPEWQAFFDDDKEKAIATRKRILEMAAAERMLVAGYHMPFPGLGSVERSAEGYRWIPPAT